MIIRIDREEGMSEQGETNRTMGWAGKSWNERRGEEKRKKKKVARKRGQPGGIFRRRERNCNKYQAEPARHRSNITWMLLAVSVCPGMNRNNGCHRHCIASQWTTRLTAIRTRAYRRNSPIPVSENLARHVWFFILWPVGILLELLAIYRILLNEYRSYIEYFDVIFGKELEVRLG